MPSIVPAMRGRFGSHEYFLTTMHVGELVTKVTIPKDMKGWDEISLEERYQRDINLNRVKKEIAPYFATDGDRFSSALILAVDNHDGLGFETLDEVGASSKVPKLYQSAARNFGFLTFSGKEVLIPLDGQHRAKAFKFAISGTDDNNKAIEGVKGNTDLAEEDIAVILVRFNPEPSRRIFSKVNRYAKPTGRGQDLITDDDDAIAVLTRAMIREHPELIPSRLVRWQSNTLNVKAGEFTTLSTLYDANVAIAKAEPSPGKFKAQSVSAEVQEVYEQAILDTWGLLLSGVNLFHEALLDKEETGDQRRRDIRQDTLLGKPIGQLVLVLAFLRLKKDCYSVTGQEICTRLNRIDWSLAHKQWVGVLMNQNGRVMSGKTTANMAADFVAHLCGAELKADETKRLREHIWGEGTPNELPEPVA